VGGRVFLPLAVLCLMMDNKPWENNDDFLARWLQDELSDEELARFEASEDFPAYQKLKAQSDLLQSPAFDEAALFQKINERKQFVPQKSNGNIFAKLAVAASIIVVIGITGYFLIGGDSIKEFTAEKQTELDLPDGSSLDLKSGSYISYNETTWEGDRSIQLKGEAFFEVEKGAKFEVVLANGSVTVLGTSFNVLEKEDTLIVTCYTGRVNVEGYEADVILEPTQGIKVFEGGSISFTDYLEQPTWLENVAAFNAVSFDVVLRQLATSYGITVSGTHPDGLKYSGDFPTDNIKVALSQVFGPLNLQYDYNTDTGVVTILQ